MIITLLFYPERFGHDDFLEILASTYGPGPYGPGPLIIEEFSKSNMLQDHI